MKKYRNFIKKTPQDWRNQLTTLIKIIEAGGLSISDKMLKRHKQKHSLLSKTTKKSYVITSNISYSTLPRMRWAK